MCEELMGYDAVRRERDLTIGRREIIQKKPLMRAVYERWYREVMKGFLEGVVVELGSGAGFLKELYPNVITTDVLDLPFVDKVCDGMSLPFADASVDRFVMIDVFHHVADSGAFLREMSRCLKVGGTIVMIEPSRTLWARFVWTFLHHEPYDPKAGWTMRGDSPLTCANSALPWIVFVRDRKIFNKKFPELSLDVIRTHTPFAYLASGGFTLPQLVPSFLSPLVFALDRLFSGQGLVMTVVVSRRAAGVNNAQL
jgi:SAM-dependent methyltransferase